MTVKAEKGEKKTRLLPEEIILVFDHLITRDFCAQITKDEAVALAIELANVHPEKKRRDWKTVKDALYYYRETYKSGSPRRHALKRGSFLVEANKQERQLKRRLETAFKVLKKVANEESFGLLLQNCELRLENAQLRREIEKLKK